jgi:hypothetical protein
MGISLSNKPGHMANSVCRIKCKLKICSFFGCLFYYYDTTFSAKMVYLRELGKIGSLNELKTPVKICLFLGNQRGKNGPASKRFRIYGNLQNDT